jgi:hypothetical protein
MEFELTYWGERAAEMPQVVGKGESRVPSEIQELKQAVGESAKCLAHVYACLVALMRLTPAGDDQRFQNEVEGVSHKLIDLIEVLKRLAKEYQN